MKKKAKSEALLSYEREHRSHAHAHMHFVTSAAVGFAVRIYQQSGMLFPDGRVRYQVMPDAEFGRGGDFYRWYADNREETWPTPEEAAARFVDGWIAWNELTS